MELFGDVCLFAALFVTILLMLLYPLAALHWLIMPTKIYARMQTWRYDRKWLKKLKVC